MLGLKRLFLTLICSAFITSVHAEATLYNMDGQAISFSALKGKWVLINYWASWCATCIDEIPELNHFYEKNKQNNVMLFAVNYDSMPLDAQQQLINQFHIRYPALRHDPARSLHLGDIRAVPATFVFNPEGELVDTLYGGQTARSLSRVLINAAAQRS